MKRKARPPASTSTASVTPSRGRHSSALCRATYRSMPSSEAASSAKPLQRNLRIMRPLTESGDSILVPGGSPNVNIDKRSSRFGGACSSGIGKHKRDLPWRRTEDPYRIWISEIMLQQTRVAAVIPYYERFLALFPDVPALASAQEQELLAAWAGLGYYTPRAQSYRRPRAPLSSCARFPADYAALRAVAGRGRLHGCGGGQHRLRNAARGAGWKCSARAEPHGGRARQYQIAGGAQEAAGARRQVCWIPSVRASSIRR